MYYLKPEGEGVFDRPSHATIALKAETHLRCMRLILRRSMFTRAELSKLSREDLVARATHQLSKEQLIDLTISRAHMSAAGPMPAAGPTDVPPEKKIATRRPFDMNRFERRHIALKVAYIGTNYSGFAYQPDTIDTVEGRLLEALEKTCLISDRQSCHISRGGRTDKGVSALGQVVALYVRSNLRSGPGFCPSKPSISEAAQTLEPIENGGDNANDGPGMESSRLKDKGERKELNYVRMLNGVLPADIRILAWHPVPLQFSARFSATHRTYK